MATGLITDLGPIGTIDRVADVLEIVDVSANASFKVTINNLVGISGGSIVSTSDTQTLSSKTLNNTNIITVQDGNFTLQDNTDNTKQAQFQLSSNTTGTTRIYSLPDATGTLVDLASTQTLVNKTLTSPVISAPSISNATISANTITGFSSSTTGNIYGIAVTSGQITGASTIGSGAIAAGAVGSTALATNAVQASQIATNAITLGYSSSNSNFTTSSTTAVQITGITSTVTIPSGGRKVKITAYDPSVFNGAAGNVYLSIWDGTVGTGTQLQEAVTTIAGSNFTNALTCIAIATPAAGSKTYNVGLHVSTNTGGTLLSSGTVFILVEAI